MSFRIKVPPKVLDVDSQPRKPVKRRIDESEGELSEQETSSPPPSAHQRQRTSSHSSQTYGGRRSPMVDVEEDDAEYMDYGDANGGAEIDYSDSRTPSSGNATSKKAAKKKRVVMSDEDDYADDYSGATEANKDDDISMDDDEGGGDYNYDVPTIKKNTKAKGKAKSTSGVTAKSSKPSRLSKPTTSHDAHMKDDIAQPSTGLKRARAGTISKHVAEDIHVDIMDNELPTTMGTTHPASNSNAKEELTTQPPQKKRKLPTIKKNRLPTTGAAGSGPGTPTTLTGTTITGSTSTSTAQAKAGPKAGAPAGATVTGETLTPMPHVAQRKAALRGNTDVDLSNANIYAELFKGGVGALRSGSSRREKDEERRKELNKMRDDARMKRQEDAKNVFDLQAPGERITRFEEKLRQAKSGALYPNFLAGKWKDLYERERRKQKGNETPSQITLPPTIHKTQQNHSHPTKPPHHHQPPLKHEAATPSREEGEV